MEALLGGMVGAGASLPFGPEALVYKVMGKMFALVSQLEEVPRVTLKCNPEDGAMLVSQYVSITPGYYMNKKHWITISLTGEVADELLKSLAEESYNLVVAKLSRKDRQALTGV